MTQAIEQKCELMGQNFKAVTKAAKMDLNMAAALGALMYTAENMQATEENIRKDRKLLKSKVSFASNLRGATNIALLAKMDLAEDPEAYLDDVIKAYELLTAGRVIRSPFLAQAATALVDYADPADYAEIEAKARDFVQKMKQNHPMLSGSDDMPLAVLLVLSGLNLDEVLAESERCYDSLKQSGFLLRGDACQSAAMILALSDKPTEWKCQRYREIRDALKQEGTKIKGDSLPIIAAFVDFDIDPVEIARMVNEADECLKKQKGFHGITGIGSQLRRTFAAALTLQVYEDDALAEGMSNSVTTTAVQAIIIYIIALCIAIAISTAISSSTH